MAKKKTKVLRPSSSPATKPAATSEAKPSSPTVQRPAEESDDVNFDDADFNQIAVQYVEVLKEAEELAEKAAKIKKRLDGLAEWLLEQMAMNKVQSTNVAGRTIYRKTDLIVSKGKGVGTDDIIDVMKEIGWKEMIRDAYNANTLKAAVKEARKNATENERMGVQFYCSQSGNYFDAEAIEAGAFGTPPVCPDTGTPILQVIDGVPANLFSQLYIEEHYKLASRKSS